MRENMDGEWFLAVAYGALMLWFLYTMALAALAALVPGLGASSWGRVYLTSGNVTVCLFLLEGLMSGTVGLHAGADLWFRLCGVVGARRRDTAIMAVFWMLFVLAVVLALSRFDTPVVETTGVSRLG